MDALFGSRRIEVIDDETAERLKDISDAERLQIASHLAAEHPDRDAARV